MNSKIKTLALLAVLSIASAGCQKENIVETQPAMLDPHNVEVRDITYTIDGVIFYTTIRGEQHWQDFLDSMFAYAKEGHKVSIKDNSIYPNAQKSREVVTYTTSSQGDAKNWCDRMLSNGYEVQMTYDPRTGIYTCTAVGPDIVNPQTDTTDTGGAK